MRGPRLACAVVMCAAVVLCALARAARPPRERENTYVVQLRQYVPAAAACARVRTGLLPAHPEGASWVFVLRRNAASTLPTDFVVLRAASREVVDVLKTALFVRRVTLESMHARALAGMHHADSREDAAGSSTAPRAAFGAEKLWDAGAYGQGVKVAVFDTGISLDNPWFENVVERTDWTDEGMLADRIGHGTFVAGLIGGHHPRCPGLAPEVELLSFRVFSGSQVSYTSWFLDAFNYALQKGVHVLNFSIGGPDAADEPFTDKVRELAAAGVIIVAAIGNDGPLWGSLNSPADMMEVVGVGGAEPSGMVSSFSSRGMTTHELESPHASYGRVKPDLVAYARSLSGPSHLSADGYRRLSGTSVASPVVAGAVALLASLIPASRRADVVNPASIKRALLASARRLPDSSMYEQGAGLLDLPGAADEMRKIDLEHLTLEKSKAQLPCNHNSSSTLSGCEDNGAGVNTFMLPSYIDFTEKGCPYMWPHCAQPLVPGALRRTVNVSIFNPGGIRAVVESVEYVPCRSGQYLNVEVTTPLQFWPWAGGMGVHLSAVEFPDLQGGAVIVEGHLRVRVRSVLQHTISVSTLPIRVSVASRPPREQRLLWDIFHSIRYPPGYVPRDSLLEPREMLDWLGDHPHTNFHKLTRFLVKNGYHIDVLDRPLACLPKEVLRGYGAVLLVDSEDYFGDEEIRFLENEVREKGLGLVVAADWFNEGVMKHCRFEDDVTHSWWVPVSGGANIPSLNNLLKPFGIAFGSFVLSGNVVVDGRSLEFESGNALVRFPREGEIVFSSNMELHSANRPRRGSLKSLKDETNSLSGRVPVLGIAKYGFGAVAAYGDSNCIDTSYRGNSCFDMFLKVVRSVTSSDHRTKVFEESVILAEDLANSVGEFWKPAELLRETSFDLLRSHSRTLSRRRGTFAQPFFEDVQHVCVEKLRRVTRARMDTGQTHASCGTPFVSVRLVEPLGSVSNYYVRASRWSVPSSLQSTVKDLLKVFNQPWTSARNSPGEHGSFRDLSTRWKPRPLYIATALLVAFYFLFRFRAMFMSPLRKHRRRRHEGQAGSSQLSIQSTRILTRRSSSSRASSIQWPLVVSNSLKSVRWSRR